MRVVYRTRMFKSLSLGKKWHQAEIGIRRIGMMTQWQMLKRKFRQKSRAEDYGKDFVDRFTKAKEAVK